MILADLEPSVVEDVRLAAEGSRRVAWARANMPVLARLRAELEQPLAGRRVGMCLHTEPKTAVLVEALRTAGAELVLTGSPATTDDAVAAALQGDDGVRVYARKADTYEDHLRHVDRVLAGAPELLLDNGADLISGCVRRGQRQVVAATEETTSGRNRLLDELSGRVPFPVVVVNDSPIKLRFENEEGIGPAVVDGFLRATNCLIAATTFAVVGYGSCGRSLGRTLRALKADVLVVELDPLRALEAAFDGMRVVGLEEALETASVVVTVTGRPGVVRAEHFPFLRDGAMLANVGHFGTEIDVAALEQAADASEQVAAQVTEYRLPGGRRVRLLGRGEMLNLSAASGHQIQIMDLGFALQALSLSALARHPERFVPGYQPVPAEIDRRVAEEALATLTTVGRREGAAGNLDRPNVS